MPLRVYLYREGFARFTNARFSLNREDLGNTLVHLTNHAVQKKDKCASPIPALPPLCGCRRRVALTDPLSPAPPAAAQRL